jgi:hypothetical protein
MIVWVLRRIYCCILLNVIVTNGCMNIMKDLLLYFIECNYDEWLYEYYKEYTLVLYRMKLSRMVVWVLRKIYRCIILNVNYHEWLYKYYRVSIIVLYWILIVMNGWMSNTKGVLLCYWMLNCYGMFCLCITKDLLSCSLNIKLLGMPIRVSRRVWYYVVVNVKLLWIIWMSNSKDITVTSPYPR